MHVGGSPLFPQQLGQISDGLNWLCLDLEGIKHEGTVHVPRSRYAKIGDYKTLKYENILQLHIYYSRSKLKKMKNKNSKWEDQ